MDLSPSEKFTIGINGRSVAFRRALFLYGGHGSSIADPAVVYASDSTAEGPYRASVATLEGCGGIRHAGERLRTNRISMVSGVGHFDTRYPAFIVDCVCRVTKVNDLSESDIDRLRVP